MTFDEVLDQVRELLHQRGRVTYRSLKLRYQLDDEMLAGVADELISAERVAVDEDGKVLVWVGAALVQRSTPVLSPVEGFRVPSSSQSLTPNAQSPAERRQLTVMFCDLVDSTALSELLDPEELREVVQAYHATCAEAITRYAGYTAQHLGDGLLVYFGYPAAHEDEAARAVRTALEILAGLQSLNARMRPALKARLPHPIQVRIGIHTGLVVIGEIGSSEKQELLALGETPNLAARLQGLAEPDTVVISAATQHLVQGLFEHQDLGSQFLKGLSTPVAIYRVVGESAAQSRFEAAVSAGLTPLVGREAELEVLRQRWETAKAGSGQVVLVSGEAGIGKSRLVQTLKEQVLAEGATRIEFRCSPYHQNSALYPIIDHLQRLLQFQRDDTPQVKLTKLQRALVAYRFPQADTVPLLATLLSLPQPENVPPLTLSPQKQKQRTQEALVAWIVEEAEKAAVYCAWEDLHWADPSTLELLTLFLEQIPATRMFTVLTFRPEFTPPWGPRSYLTPLTLSRLGRSQVEAMIAQVTAGKPLPAEVVEQIRLKTDGVPLFVEELTKMVLETLGERATGVGKRSDWSSLQLAIPSTLQDSLMARLDRLAPVREIAQTGATVGREFSYDLLHAVSPLDEAALQHGLRQLVEAELIYQRGLPPQATYLFKHALIQDTAYQSLLKSKRQQYHQQIAQVLAERFPDTIETQPELLAHHYTEANLKEQALPYWQQAGDRANQRSAYAEAISHFTKGLELLKTLADTPERVQQELTFQLALSDALGMVRGYTAPEVKESVNRARALCQQVGETLQLFSVLFRLCLFYVVRGELQTTSELAEQMMRLAQSVQDSYLLSIAHMGLGCTLFLRGELISARPLLEQAIALYDPQQHPRPTVNTADPRLDCLSYAAWTLWCLGYPDQGLQRSQEAVTLAEGLSHPFSLAYALGSAAPFHVFRREESLAQERAEAVITLSTEQGFPFWLARGAIVQGWALAEQGQVEEGIVQLQQGLAAFRAMGAEWGRPYYLALLAETYGKEGQAEEGLAVLPEALDVVGKSGERFYEAELYRLKGELTLQQESQKAKGQSQKSKMRTESSIPMPDAQGEAETCFLKAIEIAQKQQAKSWELRATMSLARLWQAQGKPHEARGRLAAIYNWFTEGFGTKDLQEAKVLLEELH